MDDACFVAPEGVYSLTEEHKQPLSSIITTPVLYPTRLSTVTVRYPPPKQASSSVAPGFAQLLGAGIRENKKDKDNLRNNTLLNPAKEREDGLSVSSSDNTPDDPDITFQAQQAQPDVTSPGATLFPEPTLFSQPVTQGGTNGKRKTVVRPKHNIRTTSSTFITRMQNAEGFAKTLQSKQKEATFLFYNHAKTFVWADVGSKSKDPLARIMFSQYPTCHDVNQSTASPERLDVIVGFSSGDLIWLDPISGRYTRLNKQGCISNAACTAVRWVPSSPTLFIASYADGTIIVFDKEREDGALAATAEHPSEEEWNPIDRIFVTIPPWHPATALGAAGAKEKTAKNPVSHWKVSRRKVVDFVFSPDVKYVAAISEDGCLRVIDAVAEQLVDCYASYFGALTCVAWSPDGRFILTGGQDDLLTIFSPWEQRVVARCQGHSSFVSAVAFDELRCDGRNYRFGSVGEDNKLILWDFSSGALHRPKFHATHQQRGSMASTISLAIWRDRSAAHLPPQGGTSSVLGSPSLDGPNGVSQRFHPAPSRNDIAVVQPVLVKNIEHDLLTAISFLPQAILTSTKASHIKLWVRPLPSSKPRPGIS